ncbi:hypothetical protein BV913_06705 [Neisseria dumasiana]|uniref:Transposase n=1 Tax=Neisseria dumasiana TaxID=1931275 RepID=A0ABX3WMH5_9NEIS|nr:hypothetical protein BV913_06705 [Neisseria dumasiana]
MDIRKLHLFKLEGCPTFGLQFNRILAFFCCGKLHFKFESAGLCWFDVPKTALFKHHVGMIKFVLLLF